MPYQNQVIQLGAAPNARFANRGPVYASVGLHFHVVLKHHRAGLSHLVPGAVLLFGKAEAIATDDCAVLKNDAVADAAVLSPHGMRVSKEIVTDFRAAVDANEAMQDGVATDCRFFVHIAIRPDMRALADFCGFRDYGSRVNPGCTLWSLIKQFNRLRKRQVRIGGPQGGERRLRSVALDGYSFFQQYR